GTVVGGVAASQLAGLGVSLKVHLLVVAVALLAVVLVVGSGLLREDEHHSSPPDAVDGMAAGTPGVAPVSIPKRWLRGPLALFALAGGCSIVMELSSSDWAAFRLSDDFGATAGVAGLAYVAFTAGMTIGRFGGDSMLLRCGHQRVADIGIALTMIGLTVASFAPTQWIVTVGYLIAGLGVATQFPKLYDDAAKYPGRPGAGLGALTGGSRVALLFTPVLVGTLASSRLSIGAATAILTLPAAFGFLVISRRTAT
ncbi:MAG: fucose permease, partial [Candidatus Aldehydirespiratoraceae bacterium]